MVTQSAYYPHLLAKFLWRVNKFITGRILIFLERESRRIYFIYYLLVLSMLKRKISLSRSRVSGGWSTERSGTACCRCRRVTGESTPRKTTLRTRRGGEYHRVTSRRHLPQTIESNDSAIKVLMHLLTCLRRVIGDRHNILIGRPWRTTPWSDSSYVKRSKVRSNRNELIVTVIRSRDAAAALLETIGTTVRDTFRTCLALFWFTDLSLPPRFVSASAKSYKEADRRTKKRPQECRIPRESGILFWRGCKYSERWPRGEKKGAQYERLLAPLRFFYCIPALQRNGRKNPVSKIPRYSGRSAVWSRRSPRSPLLFQGVRLDVSTPFPSRYFRVERGKKMCHQGRRLVNGLRFLRKRSIWNEKTARRSEKLNSFRPRYLLREALGSQRDRLYSQLFFHQNVLSLDGNMVPSLFSLTTSPIDLRSPATTSPRDRARSAFVNKNETGRSTPLPDARGCARRQFHIV